MTLAPPDDRPVAPVGGSKAASATTRSATPPTDEMLALQVAILANLPTILWGLPGEGKTASIEGLAAALGAHAEVIIGSQFEPTDIAGQPWVLDGHVQHLPPGWAWRISNLPPGTPAVVFFDELDKCPMAVQNACLRIIRERVVGDSRLPATCRMVAAANPPELGGWDLPAPMANRFVHIDWRMDPAVVIRGLATRQWPVAVPLAVDGSLWGDALAHWGGLVGAFLHARPQLVRAMPPDEPSQGRAWPSPRTWEMAISACATWAATGQAPIVRTILVNGLVGQGPAAEFLAWVDQQDLPLPESVLEAPLQIPLPKRPDQLMAVTASVAAAVAAQPTQARIDAALSFLDRVCAGSHRDAAMPAARAIVDLLFAAGSSWLMPAEDRVQHLMQLMRDAGMI